METAEEIEAEFRSRFPDPPGYPIQVNGVVTHETGDAYEAHARDVVARVLAREAAREAEQADQTRLTQLLTAVETGTAAEALAALRVLVPRLVRREPR